MPAICVGAQAGEPFQEFTEPSEPVIGQSELSTVAHYASVEVFFRSSRNGSNSARSSLDGTSGAQRFVSNGMQTTGAHDVHLVIFCSQKLRQTHDAHVVSPTTPLSCCAGALCAA